MNSGCSETNAIRLLREKIDYLQKNLPVSLSTDIMLKVQLEAPKSV